MLDPLNYSKGVHLCTGKQYTVHYLHCTCTQLSTTWRVHTSIQVKSTLYTPYTVCNCFRLYPVLSSQIIEGYTLYTLQVNSSLYIHSLLYTVYFAFYSVLTSRLLEGLSPLYCKLYTLDCTLYSPLNHSKEITVMVNSTLYTVCILCTLLSYIYSTLYNGIYLSSTKLYSVHCKLNTITLYSVKLELRQYIYVFWKLYTLHVSKFLNPFTVALYTVCSGKISDHCTMYTVHF